MSTTTVWSSNEHHSLSILSDRSRGHSTGSVYHPFSSSGSVLVLQSGSLVGIFTERDILRALAHSANADLARISSVTQWMTRDPVTIGPDTTVGEALNQMLFGGFRHLPVMDGDAVVGMVSMRDLAKSIAKE